MFTCENCDFSTNRTKAHLLHHIRNHIPTKIKNNDCHLLPSRADFLDTQVVDIISKKVAAREPVLFMPNTITEKKDFVGAYGAKTQKYVLQVFGVLQCGSNACVKITGIEPFFDIKIPSSRDMQEGISAIKSRFLLDNVHFTKCDTVYMRPQKYFVRNPLPYLRVYFNNLEDRKKALASVNSHNNSCGQHQRWETSGDDAVYYPKVARELRFKTADWNVLANYEIIDKYSRCEYNFSIDINDYKKLSLKRRRELLKTNDKLSQIIDRDSLVVAQWDIETYRTIQNGLPPRPSDNDFTIFTICTNYYYHHTAKPLFTVCTTTEDCGIRPGIDVTIISNPQDYGNKERNMLVAHCEHLGLMMPNQLYAFNGGNFDWPLVKEKLKRNSLLVLLKTKLAHCNTNTSGNYAESEASVYKYCFRGEKFKINAEMSHVMEDVAQFPGVLDIDVMPMFMKLYPRNEVGLAKSLNFFLQKNGLSSKDDMPYKLMFKIYERATILAAAPKKCHCNEPCKACTQHLPMLDNKIAVDNEDFDEIVYSEELHDDLKDKCCYCGKLPRNFASMADVNHYCYIDCMRPQELCVKRTLLVDKREVSNQAYVPLYDAFYRADGSKVRNLIGKYAFIFNIAFSNARSDVSPSNKDHYPGAHVFNPIRGIHRRRPITGLDFASLYPSIMMTYSLSPEMVVLDPAEAEQLIKDGYTLHQIGPFNYEKGEEKGKIGNQQLVAKGWTVRHNGILHPKKDKNIVTKYEKMVELTITTPEGQTKKRMRAEEEPEFVAPRGAKISRRVGYDAIRGREALPGEQMGLMSYVVKKLFDKRVPVKAEWVGWGKLIEKLEAENKTEIAVDGITYTKADILFYFNKAWSKQQAIKLLANTFYGESGNYRSSAYKLEVAGGVTSAGQDNIKKVEKFVSGKGFVCYYGDTDSLYLAPPDRYFTELDADYEKKLAELAEKYPGVLNTPTPTTDEEKAYHKARAEVRVKYWHQMVEITMKVMMDLKEEVSDFLLADNGTCFLNMAYEEVGMPSLLCGKKKYAMMPHQEIINFYNEDLFLRGIDFIKQGQTALAKQMGLKFLKELLSPECERDVYDLAVDHIKDFYKVNHKVNEFVLTGKYKPDKKNVPIHTFVRRMNEMKKLARNPIEAALYEPPEPGDKFKYVIVNREQRYNIKGTKIEIKKGDKMEYLRVFEASQKTDNQLTIDINYYMKNAIVGIFARFIAYYKDFQPPEGMYDISDKVQYKQMDAHCVNQAGKFLESLCDTVTGFSKTTQTEIGKKYKTIYRNTVKVVKDYVKTNYGGIGDIIDTISVKCEDGHIQEMNEFINQMRETAESNARSVVLLFPAKLPEGPPLTTRKYYCNRVDGILKRRLEFINQAERTLISSMYKTLQSAIWVIYKYERNIMLKIEDQKVQKSETSADLNEEDIQQIADFSDNDIALLGQLKEFINKMTTYAYMRLHSKDLEVELDNNANKMVSEPIKPVIKLSPIVSEPIGEYEWK